MSVIAGYTPPGSTDVDYIVTVKGAPEILKDMLAVVPDNFDKTYLTMARQGARVLALGHRRLGMLSYQQVRELSREDIEKDLTFVGFVIISCPLKPDSKAVVREIRDASHHVVMITGDNPLTACHVAKELHITRSSRHTLVYTDPNERADSWHWQSIDDSVIRAMPTTAAEYRQLSVDYDLCLTGQALTALLSESQNHTVDQLLPRIKVYARVAPKQKEFVITTLKRLGYTTLMCGDGTNDVGALKHAHVGVALLANAPVHLPEKTKRKKDENGEPTGAMAAEPLQSSRVISRASGSSRVTNRPLRTTRSDDAVTQRLSNSQKKMAEMLKQIEEEEKAQIVRLGDASIASPFTSKLSTTQCVCHIIKQGRCTLVTTLQMFKILALNALILAYSQSVLYLDGVKFSDMQATMQGLLLAGCFLFISRSKPLKTLSRQRPLPNIFNAYTVLTVLGQFAVHFSTLVFLKAQSELRSPPKEEFVDLEAEFQPSLINTTIYIISMSMQITTFAVNYKGEPFMESMVANKPLMYSLLVSASAVLALASGLLPDIMTQFQLVEFDVEFRNTLLLTIAADVLGSLLVDRLLQLLCAYSPTAKLDL